MNQFANMSDLQELTARERIAYFERELQRITPPKTYRERVLVNVYGYLLQSTQERETPLRPTHVRRKAAVRVFGQSEAVGSRL